MSKTNGRDGKVAARQTNMGLTMKKRLPQSVSRRLKLFEEAVRNHEIGTAADLDKEWSVTSADRERDESLKVARKELVDVLADLAVRAAAANELREKLDLCVEVLHGIAAWGQEQGGGKSILSSLDEPGSASKAREVLTKLGLRPSSVGYDQTIYRDVK